MRVPRARLTVRGMMVAVAVAAIASYFLFRVGTEALRQDYGWRANGHNTRALSLVEQISGHPMRSAEENGLLFVVQRRQGESARFPLIDGGEGWGR